MNKRMIAAIDKICEAINCRNRKNLGVDIGVNGLTEMEVKKLEELFTINGEVLTCEAVFGDRYCLCWGKTEDEHKT